MSKKRRKSRRPPPRHPPLKPVTIQDIPKEVLQRVAIVRLIPTTPTEEPKMNKRAEQTRVTHMQFAKLFAWAQQDASREYIEGHTDEQTATAAASALGFPLSAVTIANLRREMGISKKTPARVDDVEPRLRAIADCIHDIYEVMGEDNRPLARRLVELFPKTGA